MIKTDIIESVYERVGFTRREAAEAVETIFEEIKKSLHYGEKVHIVGFGSFQVVDRKERIGRNPRTGEEVRIAPRKALVFKPSQILKRHVNQ